MEDYYFALILGIIVFGIIIGITLFFRIFLNKKKSLNLTYLRIIIPKTDTKDDKERDQEQTGKGGDQKETIAKMKQFFDSIHSSYNDSFSYKLSGQDHLSFEYALINKELYFYIGAPVGLIKQLEKQVTSYYNNAIVEEVPCYNIFKEDSVIAACTLTLKKEHLFPFRTYNHLDTDPINTITNSLSKFGAQDGAAIQILIRPIEDGWQKSGRDKAIELLENKKKTGWHALNPIGWLAKTLELIFHGEDALAQEKEESKRTSQVTDDRIKAMEEKHIQTGFETTIRIICTGKNKHRAKSHLETIKSAFTQYNTPDLNALKSKSGNLHRTIKKFILREFDNGVIPKKNDKKMILCSEELASLFHFPNSRFNASPAIHWQKYKVVPPPKNLPEDGLYLGTNNYRGTKTKVFLKNEDRFRHFYIIGQTGTGKSSIMFQMLKQDIQNGKGVAVVDPHGSLIDEIMPHIPKERADDIIYFNPADLDRPLGLNLLEANSPEEMDLVALDAMNIMIKLFDEEIFGPRIQDYFRNGCLTLMEQPDGGALTDIIRLFTDDDYQQMCVSNVKNPVVRSFWENQMAKTGAREKAEMIPYFAAKFGQFITNSMMRNIIGQTKSAFDFSKVMQEGKILLMNLSKGETGEINSKLIGLIIVSKIQMAALRRQKLPKSERKDFFLYIDEFQNYITDSIESILSEARKYRLGLIMAHQYITQLEGDDGKSKVRDAVFGNVGSICSFKIGATDAEYMAKEFAPVFTEQDLINIDKFKTVMKLSIDSQPSAPFNMAPGNPYLDPGHPEHAEAFKQLSRLTHGRSKDFVEKEIFRRMGI